MTEQQILEALRPLVHEGHLSCPDALALAARMNVAPGEIGRLCDQHGIRIVNCQLGCFGRRGKPRGSGGAAG